MLMRTQDPAFISENWLTQFEAAVSSGQSDLLNELLHEDCHWRDLLAITWTITTLSERGDVVEQLQSSARQLSAHEFKVDHERTAPRWVNRAGRETIEAIFGFKTKIGTACGVVRLTEDSGLSNSFKAWTLLTALEDLSGDDRRDGMPQSTRNKYARDFRGPNWLDNRKAAVTYADRDPQVVVVGAGQAGLAIAAHLTQLEVDTLIVDREKRVGDNWRKRYHALTLHNQTHVNHLPFMPFPANWPTYIPKDKLANWFEAYAESMELNCWTETEFEGGIYDDKTGRWTVSLRRSDDDIRTMHPRHVIMATGVSGIPNWPEIPSLQAFQGTVIHASQYTDGEEWRGRKAIVLGTGNSGHDIAQDLHSAGSEVSLVQRSPTLVVNIEPSAQLPYALYDEGPPTDDCDLIATSIPLALARESHKAFTKRASALDKPLLDALERRGFKLDFGEDGTGWQFKYLTRGGGYYFNVGCSDLIADGRVRLVQWSAIDSFTQDGARLQSGETIGADLIVLATGYQGQEALVSKLFGEETAQKVGPIWGFGDDGELRSMYRRTGQPGLWFIAGSLAQCRIYSKYLGLQIKAIELDLMSLSNPY